MSEPTREQVSFLRWFAILCAVALFVSDYYFDAWAKPPPSLAYWVCASVAAGVDVKTFRALILQVARSWAGGQGDKS